MLGIHGHRRDLAHARCWPGGLLLRGTSTHQGVESRSALNESVQGFLYTRVIKIDTWSRAGGSLTTRCDWHAAWWGDKTLGSRWRRARHGLAGWILGGGRAKGAVGLRLWGGRPSRACWCPGATVEQAEDFSLQLLLMAWVSWSTWTSW